MVIALFLSTMYMILSNRRGVTLIELIIVLSIIGILAIIGVPEISRFSSTYKARSCATDLIQNMKVAKAMAIKENREYLITFDTANQRYMIGFSSNDNDLRDLNLDTFGICKDTDGDRLPNGDSDTNPADGVPDCVKVVNLSDCGNNIQFGTLASKDPQGDNITCNGKTVCFSATSNPIRADFNPDGSAGNLGSVYFQQASRGYSYCVRVSNSAGALNMWKWDGDKDNTGITTWTELR